MTRIRWALRPALVALAIAGAAVPHAASAQNFFDFLFNGGQPQKPQRQQQQQAPSPVESFFADPFGMNTPAPPPPRAASSGGSGPAFCVRSCDGKYFPLMSRVNASPAQMCQAFCPAATTKIYFGSTIENASSGSGERYADSENAFAYRKALKAGDVVATSNGLVAFSGVRLGAGQSPDFTPVNSFPGLTSDVRAKLGEMKVAPMTAEAADTTKPVAIDLPPVTAAKPAAPKTKRVELAR